MEHKEEELECPCCFENECDAYALFSCNHQICISCAVKQRMASDIKFPKGQSKCKICNQFSEAVFISKAKSFENWREYQKARDSRATRDKFSKDSCFSYYMCDEIKDKYAHLRSLICPFKCTADGFSSWELLNLHVMTKHQHHEYCKLCVDNLIIFPKDHRCYTKEELTGHMKGSDPKRIGGLDAHPLCPFCKTHFFDKQVAYKQIN